MYPIIFTFLLSASAMAARWSQLSIGETYSLIQNFQLSQFERSDSRIDFTKGEKFTLKDKTILEIPGTPVDLLTFDYKNCPGRDMVTDLEVIPVKGSNPLVEVGAEVVECELFIYMERKDFFNKSLFE
jgi:hypothetical protein